MGSHWARIAVVAALAFSGITAASAKADDMSAWLKARQARFAAFKRHHPHEAAEIAKIKAKTAFAIAASSWPDADHAALDPPTHIWSVTDTPVTLWDGPAYPKMVVIPAGEYTMGSPDGEAGRDVDEGPRHRVRIGYSFAMGVTDVTVAEFRRFVAETHYDAGSSCTTNEPGAQPHPDRSFLNPSYSQTIDDPVVCMNLDTIQAYLGWLSKKTGHAYRLATEAEYEYAERAGSTTPWWWGADPDAQCVNANGSDLDTQARFTQLKAANCHDGYVFTAPVGRFKPNPFGLYDMAGEVWSVVADCWNDSYAGAPNDGSAMPGGDCGRRVMRSGSWNNDPLSLRSARRSKNGVIDRRAYGIGFRVVRTL